MIYDVVITEVLRRTVTIESSAPLKAEMEVRKKYANEDIVLDAGDFQGVDFKTYEHGSKQD